MKTPNTRLWDAAVRPRSAALFTATALTAGLAIAGCGGEDEMPIDDMTDPTQGLTLTREGALVHQEGPATAGSVAIGTDASGMRYVVLKKDFSSDFASGTVGIYLAKTDANLAQQRNADAASVSPKLGNVNENGAHRFAIPSSVNPDDFKYLVVWCETVAINFAAGRLGAAQQDTTLKSGMLAHQDGPQTSGMVAIVENGGKHFVTLGADFASDFASGTVTVYLAKSDANLAQQRSSDSANVSVKIGNVNENGTHRFEIPSSENWSAFNYVVIWCETVAINFAAGQLQPSS